MKRIVILASGSGTNAENLIRYFNSKSEITVAMVLTNNRHAKVIDRCNKLNTSCLFFNRNAIYKDSLVLDILSQANPDLIVLAGFLWKVPQSIINAFPGKIINIHPALLPKYGGKGMYGHYVHEAVIANKETESGISIHYVNEHYDEGAIIFQKRCAIDPSDSADDLAAKIHDLEMKHFPIVVESLLTDKDE